MAAAAGTIFYFRDEIRGKIDEATSTGSGEPKKEVIAKGDGGGSSKKPDNKTNSTSVTRTKRNPGTQKPPVKPVDPIDPLENENDAAAKRYPMPKFKSIEQAVANWKAIPPSAFPRQITLSEPVKTMAPMASSASNASSASASS